MPWMPIANVGQYGIIKDLPPHLLPPNAWSDGKNVRFSNSRVRRHWAKSKVYSSAYDQPPTTQTLNLPAAAYYPGSTSVTYELDTGIEIDQTRIAAAGSYFRRIRVWGSRAVEPGRVDIYLQSRASGRIIGSRNRNYATGFTPEGRVRLTINTGPADKRTIEFNYTGGSYLAAVESISYQPTNNEEIVRFADSHSSDDQQGATAVLEFILGQDETNFDPHWGINIEQASNSYWVYSSLTKLYSVLGTTSTEITRIDSNTNAKIDYDVDERYLWTGGNLSGKLIINNGNDAPQSWGPGDTNAENLANWPDNLTCKVLRPFGYFLVAFNLSTTTHNFRDRVRWSNPAVPGSLPTSWVTNNPAFESGQVDLSDDSSGEIVDAVQLRNWMIIYKNNATHAMSLVGGNAVFAFQEVFPRLGALETHCVTGFSQRGGEYHCVFTGDDVIIHDGRVIQETLTDRVARHLSRSLTSDGDHWTKSFVVNFPSEYENWICYVEAGNTYPNKALIWNYRDNTTSFIDLPENINWISSGVIDDTTIVNTWNAGGTSTWDGGGSVWDEGTVIQRNLRPLGFVGTAGDSRGMWRLDDEEETEKLESRLERQDFAFVPDITTVQPVYDPGIEKTFQGIRFYFKDEQETAGSRVATTDKNKAEEQGLILIKIIAKSRISSENFELKLSERTLADGDIEYVCHPAILKPVRAFDIILEANSTIQWELLGMELNIEYHGVRQYGGDSYTELPPRLPRSTRVNYGGLAPLVGGGAFISPGRGRRR